MEEGASPASHAPWLDLTVDQLIVRRWGGRVAPAVWRALLQTVLELGYIGRMVGDLTDGELEQLARAFRNASAQAAIVRETAAVRAAMGEQRAVWADVLQRAARRHQQARTGSGGSAASAKPDPKDHNPAVQQAAKKPQPKQPAGLTRQVRRPSRWRPGA
jgi:hypothetical protein